MPRPRRTSERVPPGTYERLVAEHGAETCWICGAAPKTRRLHIDHDHKTGDTRGLLCYRCNNALPAWVTALWLVRAALYLRPERYAGTLNYHLRKAAQVLARP